VGELAAFQLTLTAPKSVTIGSLPFSRVAIHFANREAPVIVEHEPSDDGAHIGSVGFVKLGEIDDTELVCKANLRWQLGSTLVIAGSISSRIPTVLKV
jgi:hypothetical protein